MEKHDYKFTGVFVPKELIYLRRKGAINCRDLWLLITISTLEKDEGCSASNEYLGKEIGASEDITGRVVSKLKKLGLIKQVAFDGRKRYIKTTF